jgi:hypothetical protein
MSESRAYVLVIALGLLGLGLTTLILDALGSSNHVLLVATMFWLIAPAFCVGAIGVHYESPRDEEHR